MDAQACRRAFGRMCHRAPWGQVTGRSIRSRGRGGCRERSLPRAAVETVKATASPPTAPYVTGRGTCAVQRKRLGRRDRERSEGMNDSARARVGVQAEALDCMRRRVFTEERRRGGSGPVRWRPRTSGKDLEEPAALRCRFGPRAGASRPGGSAGASAPAKRADPPRACPGTGRSPALPDWAGTGGPQGEAEAHADEAEAAHAGAAGGRTAAARAVEPRAAAQGAAGRFPVLRTA